MQQALCLDKSQSSSNGRIKGEKTFSPTANGAATPPQAHHNQQRKNSRTDHYYQQQQQPPPRRRPRPPSYHRVARREPPTKDEVYFDRSSRTFARYSRRGRLPNEAYNYYSDEDTASYYYIEQALPYAQWKEMLLRQGSLCEITSSQSSALAFATEWLV